MRTLATAVIGAVILGAGLLGAPSAIAGEDNTPTLVCHWVPAHGGSFVTIVVDDDAANGNNNLRAHAQHVNDIIEPAAGECGDPGDVD